MKTPSQFSQVSGSVLPPGPLHLAIGMFDGVHLGHRAVIEAGVAAARSERGVAAVLTFWPHPSALFRPRDPTRLIQTPETKARVLARLGVDAIITEPFTREFACIPAELFLTWLKQRLPALRAVYVGENFRFGHQRLGNVEVLARSGRALGIAVKSAARLTLHGEPVSSTRIRAHLAAGEMEAANALLGYPYFAAGVVTPGKQLGRTIGVPTLNVPWSPDLRPRFGVYAVRVQRDAGTSGSDGSGLPAVANYGLRPTVEQSTEPRLEIHLIGPCPFDAGDRVGAAWEHFLRPEAKFASLAELKARIARDQQAASRWFGRAR